MLSMSQQSNVSFASVLLESGMPIAPHDRVAKDIALPVEALVQEKLSRPSTNSITEIQSAVNFARNSGLRLIIK